MSEWIEVKNIDIDIDEKEDMMNVWVKQDDFGAVYAQIKLQDIRDMIADGDIKLDKK